jgi:uncharacterized membrane protein
MPSHVRHYQRAVQIDTLRKALLIAIIILSLVGMADAGYAVSLHYDDGGDSFCSMSETVNCDVVNQSKYSEFVGIPVAGMGVFGYFFYLVLAAALLAGYRFFGLGPLLLVLTALAGVVFSLVLTYIELFILEAICILCVVSQVLVLLILGAAVAVALIDRRSSNA